MSSFRTISWAVFLAIKLFICFSQIFYRCKAPLLPNMFREDQSYLVYVILSGAGILSAVASLFLDETRGTQIPSTVAELERSLRQTRTRVRSQDRQPLLATEA